MPSLPREAINFHAKGRKEEELKEQLMRFFASLSPACLPCSPLMNRLPKTSRLPAPGKDRACLGRRFAPLNPTSRKASHKPSSQSIKDERAITFNMNFRLQKGHARSTSLRNCEKVVKQGSAPLAMGGVGLRGEKPRAFCL